MRVVAGELRGRKIEAPEGKTTRPTTDKAREATFNALGSAGVIIDAYVVDAFAGSGALGIEALSRGAAHCTFIERDRDALEVLKRNVETLGLTDRATIVRGDAMQQLAAVKGATLIVADPPVTLTSGAGLRTMSAANLLAWGATGTTRKSHVTSGVTCTSETLAVVEKIALLPAAVTPSALVSEMTMSASHPAEFQHGLPSMVKVPTSKLPVADWPNENSWCVPGAHSAVWHTLNGVAP